MDKQQTEMDSLTQKRTGEETAFEILGNCLIIRLGRDLDHHNAVSLRKESDKLLDRNNIRHIIFDFSRSHFMDSSGIGVIMGRYKRVIFTGGKVAVTGVGASVDRIFNISGLYRIIERFDTVEDAVRSL